MVQSNRDIIQELQTELLQDFFETQMINAFPQGWKGEVYSVACSKVHTPFSTYREMKGKFDEKGQDNISVKDFDVTALTALMRFDFSAECCPDNETWMCIGRISIDRNAFSHISDYKDIPHILAVEETAIVNMKEFLTHLQDISWNQPVIYRKYLGTGHNDGSLNEIYEAVHSEAAGENEYNTRIRRYVQELQLIREERAGSYVGLSYNLEGKETDNDKKFMLDELIESNLVNRRKGMRLKAEGGFGKTWTLFEIAGRYAEKYLDENDGSEKIIPVMIEMGKLYKDCPSIKAKVAQLLFNGDESQVMTFYKSHQIILFVDAMDEAPAEIQNDVSRELASLRDIFPNIILVCASRSLCIEKYPLQIPCYVIRLLGPEQISAFLEKAFSESLLDKVKKDWIGEKRKMFLYENRTPFYINCYVELVRETGDTDFVDTTQLVEKFLNAMINRELRKTGFNSDKATFINFLKEFCRLLDAAAKIEKGTTALPENDVIRKLTERIMVEDGKASIKAVGRKLVEILILARDDDEMLLSFAHQNYKEYINRKYPERRFRSWR